MKFIFVLLFFFLFQSCSFDKKSGIWKNENIIDKTSDSFKDFETLIIFNTSFNSVIENDNFTFKLIKPAKISEWSDIYFQESNNFKNFSYGGQNELILKSKKLSRYNTSDYILYKKNNVILSDDRGNIINFSINQNEIIDDFNFYKKHYKKIRKNLNLIIQDNIVFVSDNLGYLYAYDLIKKKIIWAKNYEIPFRSNLKIFEDKLITSNQNNILYFFDKNSGNILKLIPTEETIAKNEFENNLSVNAESLYFLNTYGSLYSIDNSTMRINWFINLNQSLNTNSGNIFKSTKIIHNKKRIVISTNNTTYIVDSDNGSVLFKKNFISILKPIIINNYLFLITKNNFLIAMDLNSGKIIYSYDTNQQIADFLNIKKKKAEYKNFFKVNNKILIFLKNSYILQFNINGKLEKALKLKLKMKSNPIFIDDKLIFLSTKKKLVILS